MRRSCRIRAAMTALPPSPLEKHLGNSKSGRELRTAYGPRYRDRGRSEPSFGLASRNYLFELSPKFSKFLNIHCNILLFPDITR